MPVERIAVSGSSWVQKAGYLRLRRLKDLLAIIGAAPFVWFFVNHDFRSRASRWANVAFVVVPTLATAWAAIRTRCSVCGIPVYAFWLLGFPRGQERPPFEKLACCPYCLDDGTGTTGDATRVDRRKEIRSAIRYGCSAVLLFMGVMAVVFVLMLMRWFPGYTR